MKNQKYFKIILDLNYIRKCKNESIKDNVVIRGIVTHVNKHPEDKDLIFKIDSNYSIAGLYVNNIKPYTILNCMSCNKEFIDEEPQMCCSSSDCGCMGMPIEPVVCSGECYQTIMNEDK